MKCCSPSATVHSNIMFPMGPESDSVTELVHCEVNRLCTDANFAFWLSCYPSLYHLMQLDTVCFVCACKTFRDCAKHVFKPVFRKRSLSQEKWSKCWKGAYREMDEEHQTEGGGDFGEMFCASGTNRPQIAEIWLNERKCANQI